MTECVFRGASRRGAPFSINLDRVARSREAIEGVFTCVQDFVRDTLVTQKCFLSDSGAAMSDSIIVSEQFNPLSVFGCGCNQHVVSGLQSCQEKVVIRRKISRDTSERWFGAQSAGLPSPCASVGRSGVRILNIVEEGQVQYVAVPEPTASSSQSVKSPSIGSKRKAFV